MGIIKETCGKISNIAKNLELALECLENNSKKYPKLTTEQKFWLACESISSICCVQKGALKILMGNVNYERFGDYVTKDKPIECVVQFFSSEAS